MKKLLLTATLLAAISATAMGAGSTRSAVLDTTVSDTLTVTATYVKPISVGLSLSEINFGDVYTDSNVDAVTVTATVSGTADETFTYTISSAGGIVKLSDAAHLDQAVNTPLTGTSTALGSLVFNVDLDTSQLVADTEVSETITINVQYDSIDDTGSTTTDATTETAGA